MSTTPPPAVKKRGRPAKKPATDDTKPIAPADAKPTVRSAPAKPRAIKEKEKEKKAPARPAAKPAAKKDAPKPTMTVRQPSTSLPNAAQSPTPELAPESAPTPAAPSTSEILTQVRATGTLKATPPQSQPQPQPQSQATSIPKNAPAQAKPAPAKATLLRPSHNTTTIPLPRAPLHAPSPKQPSSIPTSSSRPLVAPAASRPRGRVIEPTPDIRLPPKYKPAARRVTAIIVGIPIILVFGWELYGRWRGEVQRKFVEREKE
ncbi:hypothetical protein HBH64_224810 [Parastagonospora nodorum]|nr:hypothetical protein HBI01_231440 [Parastagonospora nodorum]KAH4308732.1 hypothetical protein HBI02_107240 [Parastagonospora nodorum]KAH4320799.1 hypothetical protein HBI00_221350 [Parastagonospora nodorum]KAH4376250.1 hypothetical protein HBH94_097830 [Parastagonospora nodorum]KAH4467476.1 hypothetical protein HBH90_082260 [Parastagonospora nodorum]